MNPIKQMAMYIRRLLSFPSRTILFATLLLLAFSFRAQAQYFGRNKVNYEQFNFRVLQSNHFDIYQYLDNESVKKRFAHWSEQWYLLHQSVLRDSFTQRNPMIIYNHHAHFQQTRAIDGQIDVGTGGVTEALKNRVILPFMESNAQTDHVLGHELVHAFQYHMVLDSFSLNALNNLPLWMVEGMAEYMSTGYVDPNTAMWLRSAVASNQLPTLKDLTNRPDLYFPYRWGEAFWAYTTGIYGDTVIRRLFLETARSGYAAAIKHLFKIDEKEFSRRWQESIRAHFAPLQKNASLQATGQSLINKSNAGELNIVPSVSPDGRFVAYWTEKNLFSLDLYIADAATGKVVERVTSSSFNAHIDQYSSYESSVAWSPDSREVAFVAFAKGRNRLIIANTQGKIRDQIDLPGLTGFSNPSWSPDGNTIVVTGIKEGQSDLYAYELHTKKIRALTNDLNADLQASFSPDGKWIVFTRDHAHQVNSTGHHYTHSLALINMANGELSELDVFTGANNMNPVFAPDGQSIYFLSDHDGFRNLYQYSIGSREMNQLTDFFTGISGITAFAPAISVSRKTGQVMYSYYDHGDYTIYSARPEEFKKSTPSATVSQPQAAVLPPLQRAGTDMVQNALLRQEPLRAEQMITRDLPYQSKFELDYLGNTGVGLQTGGGYGTGLAGGVNGIFSDMLGNHQLFGGLSLNGELVDIAAQTAYLNQKKRLNWGTSISHIPYLSGAQYLFRDTILDRNQDSIPVLNYSLDLLRTFQDQLSVFASYPFSTIRRVEAGASFARYYYRLDRYTEYYDETGTFFYGNTREKQPVPSGFNLGQGYVALVGDNSFFGVASPLAGHRFRVEAGQFMGAINLTSINGDYRKYFRFTPITLATRNMYIARFGRDAESGLLPPLFLGYPSLVRGYDALEYADQPGSAQLTINDLIGSRMYVGNVELRLPLSGPERLSAIKSRFLFTELNLFTDGGMAWGSSNFIRGSIKDNVVERESRFIMSSGISLRLNLFGYLIIEPYYAIPWQNGGWKSRTFGINLQPGW